MIKTIKAKLKAIRARVEDHLHEKKIQALFTALTKASTNEELFRIWTLYLNEISKRSPDQVKRMERDYFGGEV